MYLLPHHHVYSNFRNPSITNQNQRRAGVSVSLRAARDRVIDFGKYKGKMLGSLPSSYLRWVSKNLRARHFEEWAKLADQVLRDPIYRDRIEWEFTLNVLNGNNSSSSRPTPGCGCGCGTRGAVSELQEISERFGWDNLDRVGWSKVDFDHLGTSKGGRIPRLAKHNLTDTQPKDHPRPPTPAFLSPSPSSRRMERRERQKTQAGRQENNITVGMADEDDKNIAIASPFPGRQALLRKVINHRTTFVS